MEYRTLEITVQYAEDLKKVNFFSKMDVYVVVSISGGGESSKQKTKTVVNHDGDANPTWSFPMKFAVETAALMQNRLMLDFEIKCERALGDRLIGNVHVPIKDLLDFPATGRGAAAAKNFVSYQVKKPSGKPKGNLTFSYQFGGQTNISAESPHSPLLHGQSTIAYPIPVVEPISISPYMMTASPGGYRPIQFRPELTMVEPPLPAVDQVYDGNTAAFTVVGVEPTSLYPPVTLGVYPPITPQPMAVSLEGGGGQYPPPPPERYPPPCSVYPPQGYFGHPPPVMQLAPDWWIVDWRYDTRCSGF